MNNVKKGYLVNQDGNETFIPWSDVNPGINEGDVPRNLFSRSVRKDSLSRIKLTPVTLFFGIGVVAWELVFLSVLLERKEVLGSVAVFAGVNIAIFILYRLIHGDALSREISK